MFVSEDLLDKHSWVLIPPPNPSDCHVHSHHASSCGAPGPELPETPRCGLYRLCRQTSRESRTEGAAHVRGREEVRHAASSPTPR